MPGSEINTIEVFLGHYGGYIGLGLSILVLFVLIPLRDRWLPSVLKQKELEHQQRLTELREDIEFRRGIERDRAAAAKITSDAIQSLSQAMVQTNERIAQILVNQIRIQEAQVATQKALNEAVADMREAVARREGYEKRKRETGPLGEDKDQE